MIHIINIHGKSYSNIGILPYTAREGQIYVQVMCKSNAKISDICRTLEEPIEEAPETVPLLVASALLHETCGPHVEIQAPHIYRIPESQKILYITPVPNTCLDFVQEPPVEGPRWISYSDFMKGTVQSNLRPDELKNLLPLILARDPKLVLTAINEYGRADA